MLQRILTDSACNEQGMKIKKLNYYVSSKWASKKLVQQTSYQFEGIYREVRSSQNWAEHRAPSYSNILKKKKQQSQKLLFSSKTQRASVFSVYSNIFLLYQLISPFKFLFCERSVHVPCLLLVVVWCCAWSGVSFFGVPVEFSLDFTLSLYKVYSKLFR